jgi:lipopolysaccharide export system permease protein
MLETFKSQIGILFVLFLIFVSQQFIKILAEAIKGVIPPDLVMTFLYLNIPALATLMLPISFFLAVLFAFGRLYSESEMVAMISCGYSPNNVLKATLVLSFFTFIFAAFNSLYLTPIAENRIDTVTENAEANAGSAPVIEGIFHKISDDGVVYVEKYNKGKELEKIFAAHWPEDPKLAPSILTALHGKLEDRDNGTWLTMTNGQRYVGIVGENQFDRNEFENFQIHIENREVQTKKRGVEAIATSQLIGSSNLKYQAELQWRIALPLSILLLTFMAVPMAKVNPRQGRYSKLFPALSLYLAYFLLLSTAKSLIEEGDLPVFSIWGVQILFLIVGLILHLHSLGKFSYLFSKTKRAKTA